MEDLRPIDFTPPDDQRALISSNRRLSEKVYEAMIEVRRKIENRILSLIIQFEDMRKQGVKPTPAMLYERGRLAKLLADVQFEIDKAALKLGKLTGTAQEKAVQKAVREAGKIAKASDAFSSDLTGFDKEAVEKLVGHAQNDAKTPLAAMFRRIGEPFARRIESTLITGLGIGLGAREIAAEIKQEIGTTTAHALTIARTEVNNAYRAATVSAYKAAGFDRYIWLSARDLRTCPICWSLHGRIFKTSVKPFNHPNCRCVLRIYAGKEKVPTGEDLFAGLTEAQQKAILGPGKFELYGQGAKLSDFVAEKRSEYGRQRSLKPLGSVRFTPPALTRQPEPVRQPVREIVGDEFPEKISDLKTVSSLGGSTGAKLVRDADGRRYVLKTGASEAHIREEFLADQIYRELGVAVPKAKLYEENGKVYKLAEFIEGKTLKSIANDPGAFKLAAKDLQHNFAADVLLSNYDVAGLDLDNILIDKAGKAWRIDNGSSLRFRARGGSKDYQEFITDAWSMRDRAKNPNTTKVFGSIDFYDLGEQFRDLADKEAKILALLPDQLKAVTSKRIAHIRDIGEYAADLQAGKWKPAYSDEVAKHIIGIRQAGVVDKLPVKLLRSGNFSFTDQDGKKFDSMRGQGSIIGTLADYMGRNGGNIRVVDKWQSSQAGSSWSTQSRIFKYFLSQNVERNPKSFYWQKGGRTDGYKDSKTWYDDMASRYGGDQVYRTSMAQYKAFMLEFLRKTEFINNDRTKKTLKLIRTESFQAMQSNKIELAGYRSGIKGFQRGAAESFSLFRPYSYQGSEITVQELKHTDIHGIYFFTRKDGSDSGSFAGDHENEVVGMWDPEYLLDYVPKVS